MHNRGPREVIHNLLGAGLGARAILASVARHESINDRVGGNRFGVG
jgi:hypothetical protein